MSTKQMKEQLWVLAPCVFVLVLATLSCGPTTPETPPPSATPVPTVVSSPPVELEPTERPSPTEVPPTAPPPTETPPPIAGYLSSAGPWLIYVDEEGLAAVNADGSGHTLLLASPAPGWLVEPVAAPVGGRVGVLLLDEAKFSGETNLAEPPYGSLWMVELPSGRSVPVVEEVFPPGSPLDWSAELAIFYSAAADFGPWSPGGEEALIISTHLGTPEVYVYNASSGSLAPISDGPAVAYRPQWSPEGDYVIWEEIMSFGTGAGMGVAGLWAAPADGGGAASMLTGSDVGGGYSFLGWHSEAEFAFTVFDIICGAGGVWVGNVETRSTDVVLDTRTQECVWSVAYSPVQDEFVLLVGGYSVEGSVLAQGLHRLDMDGNVELVVAAVDDRYEVLWSEAVDAYLFPTRASKGLELYAGEGVLRGPFPGDPWTLTRSPDGNWLAAIVPEEGVGRLLVGPALDEMEEIYQARQLRHVLWAPDSDALFASGEGRIIRVDRASGDATVVDEATASRTAMAWVHP